MVVTLNPKDIDVVILCGGFGKRLRSVVNDRPKPMAEINGTPFLDILINYVAGYGYRRFILCTGYMGSAIKKHYHEKTDTLDTLCILFSHEEKALGTGGALKNAEPFIKSKMFLVLNGDSFCPINIKEFVEFHLLNKAIASVAVINAKEGTSCGVVRLGTGQRIIAFNEKSAANPDSLVNAGMYVFEKDVLNFITEGRSCSLEYDLFPSLISKGLYGYIADETLVDIGTPEGYGLAKQVFGALNKS